MCVRHSALRPGFTWASSQFLESASKAATPATSGKPLFVTVGLSRPVGSSQIGDRQPRTIPTKDLLHQVVFLGGWCANFRNLRKRQHTHHPQFCTRDVDRKFCGGGAWISGSDRSGPRCRSKKTSGSLPVGAILGMRRRLSPAALR